MWIDKVSEIPREAAAEAVLPRRRPPSAPGHRADPSPKG
ncbi:hypothetical protein HNQ79_004410 [Streptomyces candidus]|uniref:Uncharacterized protein n=1 Tax=Streptomyces candidus TaxID=67283 RepID=A0A7X0HHV7_9ACTN|nr:hypothetical protein [Streptomyces candidus]